MCKHRNKPIEQKSGNDSNSIPVRCKITNCGSNNGIELLSEETVASHSWGTILARVPKFKCRFRRVGVAVVLHGNSKAFSCSDLWSSLASRKKFCNTGCDTAQYMQLLNNDTCSSSWRVIMSVCKAGHTPNAPPHNSASFVALGAR
eukprot:TRINITY_DN94811_c0_g1_i1.p2 TRINITY_DN94811_c0_g1~~TRINITY_DN94811_c0_g1_i1.p2  ORF type:complete len:146 (+),score=7.41 TRINITY_DN94811_c0_g1_i1:392-829(+)